MKLRYLAIGVAAAGVAVALVTGLPNNWKSAPVPEALVAVSDWKPAPLQNPAILTQPLMPFEPAVVRSDIVAWAPEPPSRPVLDVAMPETKPPMEMWSGSLSSGETLDALLSKAGLSAPDRAEVALALAAEYDLRKLKPGYGIEVETSLSG